MLLFKKSKVGNSSIPKQNKKTNAEVASQPKAKTVKTVTRIGFGKGPTPVKEAHDSLQPSAPSPSPQHEEDYDPVDKVEEILTELNEEDTQPTSTASSKGKQQTDGKKQKRKKTILPKDLKGKPVYLEDTGEKIGSIFDIVYDEQKHLIGYKIKDEKTETILSFPPEQFDDDKNGLIFVPSWYTKGIKSIEKMEFKDRITPELTWLLSDETLSGEELYNIFVKHDKEIQEFLQEATGLREVLSNRLQVLEKERIGLKDDLMDLTEKRLIKDIDRRKFSEIVMDHRRKVNVLDVNIHKCKDLLKRLDKTSFGMLSITLLSKKEEQKRSESPPQNKAKTETNKEEDKPQRIDLYKDKYFLLKQRYEGLETEYNQLKEAVEKILNKTEFL